MTDIAKCTGKEPQYLGIVVPAKQRSRRHQHTYNRKKEQKQLQSTLLKAIQHGLVKSTHDVSDGGLGVALAECCITNREHQLGADIQLSDNVRPDCLLFGETQSRIVISCSPDKASQLIAHFNKENIPCTQIGTVGGNKLKINNLIDQPLESLSTAFFTSMTNFMEVVG